MININECLTGKAFIMTKTHWINLGLLRLLRRVHNCMKEKIIWLKRAFLLVRLSLTTDNAMKVWNFYESKYDCSNNEEYSKYTFIVEDGHMLEFYINTEEMNQSSVISSININ